MIKFVATVKEKNKRVAIAIATYPDGATTCIARAQDFLSDATGIPRHELNVQWLDSVQSQKNFVLPDAIPVYEA